jgi:hypothetical protein
MLCNTGDADGGQPRRIADTILTGLTAPVQRPAVAPSTPGVATSPLARYAGMYVSDGPLTIVRIVLDGERLRAQGGPFLEPAGPGAFRTPADAGGVGIAIRPHGEMELTSASGEVGIFRHETPATPKPEDLTQYAGTYASEEAGATLIASVKGGFLVITPADRPSAQQVLNGVFKDGFMRPGGLVRFLRDGEGQGHRPALRGRPSLGPAVQEGQLAGTIRRLATRPTRPILAPMSDTLIPDDLVGAFQIEGEPVRGRVVRLGATIDAILRAHDYPEPVANLLGEACALAALVGSNLKFEGRLLVEARGSGPVSFVIADYDTTGALRGYCRFDPEAVEKASTGFVRPGARTCWARACSR